ncbi:MAG: SDR family oxidoreductase [Leptospirales bacterium]
MKKTILITGASSGIGTEFARLFAKGGNNLILTARNTSKLESLKNELITHKIQIKIVSLDLSLPASADKLFEVCESDNIDILINNAGIGLYGEHTSIPQKEIEAMINLNITSLITLCRVFGDQMKLRKSGSILNVASTAAYQPVPTLAAYAASKSFVLNFSEAISQELYPYGVVVSCLSPGHTDTEFFTSAGIESKDSGFFSTKGRIHPSKVAQHGINILFKKKISSIPGVKNYILAFSNRFAPRAIVARLSKLLLSGV